MLRLRFVYVGKARDLKQALDALRRRGWEMEKWNCTNMTACATGSERIR